VTLLRDHFSIVVFAVLVLAVLASYDVLALFGSRPAATESLKDALLTLVGGAVGGYAATRATSKEGGP